MKARCAVLVVLVAALTLTSVAAASPNVTKQRVAITATGPNYPVGVEWELTPLQAGALKADSGTQTATLPTTRFVRRGGQRVALEDWTTTLKGKRGTLVILEVLEFVNVGNGYSVFIGTWKVLRGTGQYANLTGGGRDLGVGSPSGWHGRREGVLTVG
jgi:hypothetical protein